MKVVHITPYYPPSSGGISRFVSGLVGNLDPSVLTQVISREGEPSERVSILRGGKGTFIINSFRMLRKMKPDVIHCHSHWHMLAPALAYRRLAENVKVIFTFHTDPFDQGMGRKGRIFGKMLSGCDAVTFVSEALKQRMSEEIQIKTRQVVIYPGVAVRDFSEEESQAFALKYRIENASPLLVFVGLLEWEGKVRGVEMLLDAIAKMTNDHPSLRLLIVGDGSKRPDVQRRIDKLGLNERATITGVVENVFVPLSLCDMYVHISLQEGMPQSLLEAMALGKPVVASRVGGIPEAVEDSITGMLVPPDSITISKTLEDLIQNEEKSQRLGRQAKDFMASKFAWSGIAEQFTELYSAP